MNIDKILRICVFLVVAAGVKVTHAASIHVLAIGQSNMEGKFGPAPKYTGPNSRINVWRWYYKDYSVAQLGVSPFYRNLTGKGVANNLAYVFAEALSKKCNDDVYLTIFASGGKKIEFFLPNKILEKNGWQNQQTDPRYGNSISDEIFSKDGINADALKTWAGRPYDVILIHQGEGNSTADGDTADTYAKKMKAFLAYLHAAKLAGSTTEIITGTINSKYPKAQQQKAALESIQAPTVGVVSWKGIEAYDKAGETGYLHATGNGLQALGERYFGKYMDLMGNNCPAGSSPPTISKR